MVSTLSSLSLLMAVLSCVAAAFDDGRMMAVVVKKTKRSAAAARTVVTRRPMKMMMMMILFLLSILLLDYQKIRRCGVATTNNSLIFCFCEVSPYQDVCLKVLRDLFS